MSLCYTSKRQLCVGLNTSFIGLLQSSFVFPMFLPYASFCGAYWMLGKIRCFKLLVSKGSIERMVFIICQPLQNSALIMEKKFSQKMRAASARDTMTREFKLSFHAIGNSR